MHLYILRHGDAVESSFYQDRDRPLSDLGKRQIEAVSHFFQVTRTKPDIILTSPLARAKQTCDIVQENLGVMDSLMSDCLVPGSNLSDLIKEINAHSVETMLIVGHEPQLSGLISILTGGDDQFKVEMKKGSLACLDVRMPVKKGDAVLIWLLAQDLLTMMR
jgi:phosphohistidine phosphatase